MPAQHIPHRRGDRGRAGFGQVAIEKAPAANPELGVAGALKHLEESELGLLMFAGQVIF